MLITAIYKATEFKITTLRGTWKAKRAEAEKEEKAKGRARARRRRGAGRLLFHDRNRPLSAPKQEVVLGLAALRVLAGARDPEADHWGQ